MEKGDLVPDFTLSDHKDQPRSLTEFTGSGPVVLFFYPAALTPGCTMESCHFRDLAAEFARLGAQRVGISADSVARQREFAETNGFDYPLLSDPDGAVATLFGVRRKVPLPGPLAALKTRRWTFVIGSDHVLLDVVKSEVNMVAHADRALEVLRARE
ncbi:peroxiredoxin [Actinosynnema sp. NPDC020468]|uniref:peroxiredoxin n=1 Tax=Actinosynnema sp. NPDC020468 TaxID=3154488 RepID=UPI0033C40735